MSIFVKRNMLNASEDTLREKWVSVRGVPTYTLCQGSKKDHNTIVIIIPGMYYMRYTSVIHIHL